MVAEMVPFSFPVDGGKEREVRPAPFVYTSNLIGSMTDQLNGHSSYVEFPV